MEKSINLLKLFEVVYVNVCKSGKKYTSVFHLKPRTPVYFAPPLTSKLELRLFFFFFNLIMIFSKDIECQNIVRRAVRLAVWQCHVEAVAAACRL